MILFKHDLQFIYKYQQIFVNERNKEIGRRFSTYIPIYIKNICALFTVRLAFDYV